MIEHVRDDQLDMFVKKLTLLVSPGGKLIIITPNGLNPFAYSFYMSLDVTHVRMHSPFTISQVLLRHDFLIEGVFREIPQIYDLPSMVKFVTWVIVSGITKLFLMASGTSIGQLRFPLIMASSFYVVASRNKESVSED